MLENRTVPVIGLVGGVGSGKSALAHWLAARRRFLILDGDVAGHQVLTDTYVKQQIRRRFGDSVFDDEGNVNRSALGRLVFGPDTSRQQSRSDLESIVHPRIREFLEGTIRETNSSKQSEAILLDAAVLFEAGWNDLCDAVVFIDTPEAVRLDRVVRGRGWNRGQLAQREASQWPLEKKRAACQESVTNAGPIEDAGKQLEQIVEGHLRKPN